MIAEAWTERLALFRKDGLWGLAPGVAFFPFRQCTVEGYLPSSPNTDKSRCRLPQYTCAECLALREVALKYVSSADSIANDHDGDLARK